MRAVWYESSSWLMYALVGVATCLGGVLSGQPRPTVLTDKSSDCRGCSVSLTPIATLTTPDSVADLGPDSDLALNSKGWLYATSGDARHVLQFNTLGALQAVIGRPGQGPGEFQRIAALSVGPGDSLFVFDNMTRRLTVFSPEHVAVRTMALPGVIGQGVALADGSVAVQVTVGPGRIGQPLRLIRADGAVLRSFGLTGETPSTACAPCVARDLHASARRDRVWSSHWNRYELESWATDGSLVRAYRVEESRWFTNWDEPTTWLAGTAPRPSTVVQVAEDSVGNLWVLGARASAKWAPMSPRPGSGITTVGGGIMGPRARLKDHMFDLMAQNTETVLDYLDLANQEVRASVTLPGELRLLNANTVARTVRRPDDLYAIEISRLRLAR